MSRDTAPQVAKPADNSNNARRPRRWPRRLGWLFLVLLGALLLAWLSFPVWAPLLAQRYVPQNWTVLKLDVQRPGFAGLKVRTLKARGSEAGLPIMLTANNVNVRYAGPQVDIQNLTLSLAQSPGPGNEAPFDPAGFSLPRLAMPQALPEVRIDTLILADAREPKGQQWEFSALRLGNATQRLDLQTVIMRAAPLSSGVDLRLIMNAGRVELHATSSEQPDDVFLSFVQTPDETDPSQATAQLEWHVDLAMINPGELAQVLALPGDLAPTVLDGQITGQIGFRGTERLRPENGAVELQSLFVQTAAASLKGDLAMDLDRDADALSAELRQSSVSVVLTDAARLKLLQELLAQEDITGLLTTDELSISVTVPEVLRFEFGLIPPRRTSVSGSAIVHAIQADSLELLLTAEQVYGIISTQAGIGLSDINMTGESRFRFSHPGTIISGDQTLGASSGTGDIALELRSDNADESLDVVFNELTLGGVSLSQPGLVASINGLSLSGALDQASALSFRGQLSGDSLVLATEDKPLAPPLLSASSFSMDLEWDEPGTSGAVVRGPLTLNEVNLPVAAVTLDSVTLDLDPISLPGLDGNMRILTTGLAAQVDGTARSGVDLDLTGALRAGRYYDGEGTLLMGYQAALPFGFTADLETTAGTMTFSRATLPVAGLGALARPLGLTLPKSLGFDAGQLIIDGGVRSDSDGITGALTLTGEDLGMSLGESNMEGLNFTTQLDLADVLRGDGNVTLNLARLAAGLDLIAMSSELMINSSGEFGARSLTAQLLGGVINVPSLTLRGGQLQDASIDWEGFDLSRLLKFVDVSGLDGTGIMDARFPLVAEADGPAIRNGSFAARGPGQLRYSSGAPAANIGLQALENFNYQSLSGTLDYGSDGGYTIGVELLGANPDLYGGYPIRFKLNLGGAMPALFRSLFITGDFDKAIIEQLRSDDLKVEP